MHSVTISAATCSIATLAAFTRFSAFIVMVRLVEEEGGRELLEASCKIF